MATKKNDTITIDKEFKAKMKVFKEALKSEEKRPNSMRAYMDQRF